MIVEEQLYPAIINDFGLCYIPGILNYLGGLDHSQTQVLKSNAGYYIGDLMNNNWGEAGESPFMVWEPNSRSSQEYWRSREEAEEALISGKYMHKF